MCECFFVFQCVKRDNCKIERNGEELKGIGQFSAGFVAQEERGRERGREREREGGRERENERDR